MGELPNRLDNLPYYVWWEGEMVRVELMENGEAAIVLLLSKAQRNGLVYNLMNPRIRSDLGTVTGTVPAKSLGDNG